MGLGGAGGISGTAGTAAALGGSAAGGQTSFGGTFATAGASAGGVSTASGGVTAGGASNGGAGPALSDARTLLLHMDESAWNGTTGEVVDASGSGNNGTSVAGATTTSSPAKFGRAGLFNGADYVSVPSSATLHAGKGFTVAAWIYPTGLDGVQYPGIFSKRTGYGVGVEFTMFAWTGNKLFVDIDTENDRFSSTAALANNAWYHVALVYDGSQPVAQRVMLYLNGQLDSKHAETSSSVTPSDAPLQIGSLPGAGNFIGAVDDVAFWQRPLGASEILGIYQSGSPL